MISIEEEAHSTSSVQTQGAKLTQRIQRVVAGRPRDMFLRCLLIVEVYKWELFFTQGTYGFVVSVGWSAMALPAGRAAEDL